MGQIKSQYSCTLALAMDIVGGKWKMIIIWQLRAKVLRFSELKRLLDGITQKMLTQQLRELESAGLVSRMVYPMVPPKVEYSLTEEGKALLPALFTLCQWSIGYAQNHDIAHTTPCDVIKLSLKEEGCG